MQKWSPIEWGFKDITCLHVHVTEAELLSHCCVLLLSHFQVTCHQGEQSTEQIGHWTCYRASSHIANLPMHYHKLAIDLKLFFLQEQRTCGKTNGGCSQICKNGRCSCYPGYFASGNSCSPGSCGSPSVQYCPSRTTYGTTCLYPTASCSGKTFGKTCTWVCKSGYGLTGGSSVIICQSSGVWSSYSTTYCKRLNQPPTKVSLKKKEKIYLQICGTFRWRLTS